LPVNPIVFLETDRLILRAWKQSDHEAFIWMNENPRVRKFYPGLLSRAETLEKIAVMQTNIETQGYGLFAAEIKDTGDFIGYIGLAHPEFESDFTPCTEIGWRLDDRFWRRGYATEGAKACIGLGFEKFAFGEIYSFTSLYNIPSEKVMLKVGMEKVGTFKHPALPADNWLSDHLLYKIKNPIVPAVC
jgi:ribosomal-protein-alanine N-acetyltransferase